MKKIEVKAHFTKTVIEKTLLEIEIDNEDLKKIESGEITLEECVHDYAFDYNYEVIDSLSSVVTDYEIKGINLIK